jgi:hypothetical protein
MPANYDYKRLIGYLVRAGAANGLPVMTDRQPGTELTGATPVFACRAWVNFNGTGTVAIRKSANVSSITDNGTGDYTINFTTAMPDANYCTIASSSTAIGVAVQAGVNLYYDKAGNSEVAPTTSAARIQTQGSSFTAIDPQYVMAAFFR